MTTNREQLINELGKLYDDIDQCIGDIVHSRLKKDYKAEGKAIFRMEGLMVATLQDLECTIDYLKLKQNEESQYSDFKELKASELTGNFKPLDMEIVKTGDKIVIYDVNPNKANHLTHPVGPPTANIRIYGSIPTTTSGASAQTTPLCLSTTRTSAKSETTSARTRTCRPYLKISFN